MPTMASVAAAAEVEGTAMDVEAEQCHWPLAKLRTRIREYEEKGLKPPKGLAVVLTTGGMNPVHKGHVQLLHQARLKLEAQGYGVVGAWLSPSHDAYLQPKARALGTIGLSSAFRVAVAREAVKDDAFVAIGSWEADPMHSRWPDYPVVAQELQEHLSKQGDLAPLLKDPEKKHGLVQVFYACGADHADKCGLYRWAIDTGIGTVVVPRDGERVEKENPKIPVYIAEESADVSSFSSTKVRKAIAAKDKEKVSAAMSVNAARLLLEPSDEERSLFMKDYALLKVS